MSGRVPMKTTFPPAAAMARVTFAALLSIGKVRSKSMTVMPAREPYAYGMKFGFKREVE